MAAKDVMSMIKKSAMNVMMDFFCIYNHVLVLVQMDGEKLLAARNVYLKHLSLLLGPSSACQLAVDD